MTQEERYRSMRFWHQPCDDSDCRCHAFNLGPVPTFGDVVLIDDYHGVSAPVCAYAVVTGGACSVADGEHGVIDSFTANITSGVTGPTFKLGERVFLDIDNMAGAKWKLLTALDRLAAI